VVRAHGQAAPGGIVRPGLHQAEKILTAPIWARMPTEVRARLLASECWAHWRNRTTVRVRPGRHVGRLRFAVRSVGTCAQGGTGVSDRA
jgi:hypothetical protein